MRSTVNEMVKKAMITVRQSLMTECPFLTRQHTKGQIAVHFRPQSTPRVSWERELSVKYNDGQMKMSSLFSRECDPDNLEMALEVIEYTLFQYIHPDRRILSGKLQFTFENGLILNILATGRLIYEDCE